MIPAYNERNRLPATLDAIFAWLNSTAAAPAETPAGIDAAEVLIVDDGSTDNTPDLVRERALREPRLRLLLNPGNRGKGYAVRHGMLEATGDWVLISDADQATPIEELGKLLARARESNSAIAIGSRALNRALIGVHQARWREASGIVFNRVMRLITGLPYVDTQCGFKLYRRDAAQIIFALQKIDGFGFDVEDLFIARLHGFAAVEVPVRWNHVEETKVSTLAGIKSFLDLLVIRWNGLTGKYPAN